MLGGANENKVHVRKPGSRDEGGIKPFPLIVAIVILTLTNSGAGQAKPFIPESEAQVLERLPTSLSANAHELGRMRTALRKDPHNIERAVTLARRYLEIGRAEGDPRFAGYAQAALRPWWNQPAPPPAVLLLRATLRQREHDFAGALEDLTRLVAVQPRNAQAWFTRAVVLQVRGDHANALRSCVALGTISNDLMATACTASVASLSGRATESYQLLERDLKNNSSADVQERLWVLTVLAEIAARLGRDREAEWYFEQGLALGVRDIYLLTTFADFLLEHDRPEQVRTLLKGNTRSDTLLLRLAIAEQRLNTPTSQVYQNTLRARYAASRLRGENRHLGDEARFNLHILEKPAEALTLAQKNWEVQRMPADAQLVLEAAVAARNPAAAQTILNWLDQTGLEDVRLAALSRSLGAIDQ